MTTNLGALTIEALKRLNPSGEKSFERLMARLLGNIAGRPFRLCRSGRQLGADALTDIPIAVEFKRYETGTLDLTELRGKIDDVSAHHQDLEVWVLVTTTTVGAGVSDLEDSAHRRGIATLFLDADSFHPPLPADIHPLAALCATDPDGVCQVLVDPDWLDPRREGARPSIDRVRAELEALRGLTELKAFEETLRRHLRELPTWRMLVEKQNQRLKRRILEEPYPAFGTGYDHTRAVRRTLETALDQWSDTAVASETPTPVVILGEQLDGKTWCTFHWLVGHLDGFDVPVFLVASPDGDRDTPLLETLIKQAEEALGPLARHARAIIQRHRALSQTARPWCLLVLDGLNEYQLGPRRYLQHVAWALARSDVDHRPSAILCTARTPFREASRAQFDELVRGPISTLTLGPFDDPELEAALPRYEISRERFQSLPADAQQLLRHPRYLRLIGKAQHLDRYVITADVLYWLNVQDKIRSGKPGLPVDWDEQADQGVLRDLAGKSLATRRLRVEDVRESIGKFTSSVERALANLKSAGVLVQETGKFKVHPERLRVGLALLILDRLEEALGNGKDLERTLADVIDPLRETDFFVAAIRSAAVFALLAVPVVDMGIIDILVTAWLSSRNLGQGAGEEIRELAPLLLDTLLRTAPRNWSKAPGNERLRVVSILVFVERLKSNDARLTREVPRWLRLVPREGGWHLQEKPDAEERVREYVADPHLREFGLTIYGDSGLLRLQNLALYLESLSPGLLAPDDFLALQATQGVDFGLTDAGAHWVFRRSLETTPLSWFEERARASSNADDPRRKAVYRLLALADRADLESMREELAPQPSQEDQDLWARWNLDAAEYERRRMLPFEQDENPLVFLRQADSLALDPSLPRPGDERLASIREAYANELAGADLQLDGQQTGEGLLYEGTISAMAAWAPDAAASVAARQAEALPDRLAASQHWWAHLLYRHAVLLHGAIRGRLLPAVQQAYPGAANHSAGRVLLSLLPGMSEEETVDVIVGHHLENEWNRLYALAAELATGETARIVVSQLKHESDPIRRRRLFFLIAGSSHLDVPEVDDQLFLGALMEGDRDLRGAAVAAAGVHRVSGIPETALLRILEDPDLGSTLAPRWAAKLLARSGVAVDRLPAYWRAVAAELHPELRPGLLDDIENALSAPGWAGTLEAHAPVVLAHHQPSDPQGGRLSIAPSDDHVTLHMIREESTIGGPMDEVDASAMQQMFDSEARVAKRNRLSREAAEARDRAAAEHRSAWEWEILPQALVEELEPHRLEAWARKLQEHEEQDPGQYQGLVLPIFRRALREGLAIVGNQWPLLFPFDRPGHSLPVRFVESGVDLPLLELSVPSAHDLTAVGLLRRLVLACRTDRELQQVALSARLRDPARLTKVAVELLGDSSAETRACLHRPKLASDSDPIRTPVPIESGQ